MLARMSKIHQISEYTQAFKALCSKELMQSMYNECRQLMHKVLLTLHGEEHSSRRNMELKIFKRDFVRYYEKEVYSVTAASTLKPYLEKGSMDLVEFGYRVNMNLSADLAGIDRPLKTPEETQSLLTIVKKFSEGATLFHSTRDKDEVRAEVSAAMGKFDEIFFQPSRRRRLALLEKLAVGEIDETNLPRDMMTLLLQNQPSSGMSDEMLRRETGFFLQAAAHSTGNSTVHAFHEISQWCAAHPEDKQRVKSDPLFLQRCVHESLRLHPASPVAWRTAVCPFAMGDKRASAEDQVMIDLETANRDKEIFGEDADIFNPHRSVNGRYPPYGLTFGVGVHSCFGRDLAGGAVPKKGAEEIDVQIHSLGTVTNLVRNLLDNNATVDPDNPPVLDQHTERQHWGKYPVGFQTP